MSRSAQRRGRAHRAHPRNHRDAEHPAEQDGGGHLRTADTPVGGMRPSGKDAPPTIGVATVVEDAGNAIRRQTLDDHESSRRPGRNTGGGVRGARYRNSSAWRSGGSLVIDHCIRALPTGAKRWASGKKPRTVNDLVELLENHQVTQRLCGGATPAPGGAGETRTERRGRTLESQRTRAPPTRRPEPDRRGPRRARPSDPERGVEVLHVRPDGPPGPPLSRRCIHAHGQSVRQERGGLPPHHLLVPRADRHPQPTGSQGEICDARRSDAGGHIERA
ncbi:unnamed protein product [Boreogadus saida]